MVQPFPCPNCQGAGCRNCNGVGFFGRDEHYEYYLAKGAGGQITVAGIKQSGSTGSVLGKLFAFFFHLIAKQLEEPYDFIWGVKQRKK